MTDVTSGLPKQGTTFSNRFQNTSSTRITPANKDIQWFKKIADKFFKPPQRDINGNIIKEGENGAYNGYEHNPFRS
ncbi:MAG: hypothetical protein WA152_04575 [Microgenomates group bacterium]